ncbi:RNA polymerase sporulation sigma factor SigK [Lachnospiraceae bacterium NSJ-143]|nr:RNA polymerase sporulation sigma factor SigK [Lachnospiraceae bacterium NSJ-143]
MTGIIIASLLLFSMGCSGAFPKPLTAEEEEKCLNDYFNGNEKAKNNLIEHNLRLVAHVVKKYSTCGLENDDLISIGTIGLIKGISSYDGSRKTRLATYAARCIDNEILMYLRYCKKYAGDLFLQEPISKDKDGNEITIMETIPTEDGDVADTAETNMQLKILYQNIESTLTPREKLIISLRYGLCGKDEMTQREIAKMLNISRSYVSRIEKKALIKLKAQQW